MTRYIIYNSRFTLLLLLVFAVNILFRVYPLITKANFITVIIVVTVAITILVVMFVMMWM